MKKWLLFALSLMLLFAGLSAVSFAEEEAQAITWETESGLSISLTPADPELFWKEKGAVCTRIGNTDLLSGACCWPGSKLNIDTLKNSVPANSYRCIAFRFESAGDQDACADAIDEIGQKAVLTLGEKSYSPKVAWIAAEYACFFFDCEEDLPAGLPYFIPGENSLAITYEAPAAPAPGHSNTLHVDNGTYSFDVTVLNVSIEENELWVSFQIENNELWDFGYMAPMAYALVEETGTQYPVATYEARVTGSSSGSMILAGLVYKIPYDLSVLPDQFFIDVGQKDYQLLWSLNN